MSLTLKVRLSKASKMYPCWEGAEGEEAKPGDLPVAKPWAYGR